MVQATASLQPAYQTNILNGKAVVTFDGTNDHMAVSSAAASGVQSVTIFMVGKLLSTKNADQSFFGIGDPSATDKNRGLYIPPNGTSLGFGTWANDITSSVASTTTGNYRVFSVRQNGGTVIIRGDGSGASYQLGRTPQAVQGNVMNMGSMFFNAATTYFATNVSVAEAIYYYADIGAAATSVVERYLGSKWGIAVA